MSESETENSQDGDSEDETEYERTTLYLRPWVKKDYERWYSLLELNMLECDSKIVDYSQKREMHEALVATAIENSEDFIKNLENRCNDEERFERNLDDLLP